MKIDTRQVAAWTAAYLERMCRKQARNAASYGKQRREWQPKQTNPPSPVSSHTDDLSGCPEALACSMHDMLLVSLHGSSKAHAK